MPPPTFMDPAQKCGLYNPNPVVRRMAVEAMGKFYGEQVMKRWERDEARAKARVQQYASRLPVPYVPVVLTDEEQVAFDDLIGDYREEKTAASEEDRCEGESNGSEEVNELAVGSAVLEQQRTEEKTTEMENSGADSAVGAAALEPGFGAAAVVEMKGKGSVADTAAEETRAKKPAQNQKEKEEEEKEQTTAPGSTAWYLQRGEELDRKRL